MEFTLSPCQDNAAIDFQQFMQSKEKYFVLTGGPGRGKSFLTKYLIDMVKDRKVYCTASTNKAAGILSEHVGRKADTIHKLFKLLVRNNFQTGEQFISKTAKTMPIHNALIVIDECSMIDNALLSIIENMTPSCKILFVGDADQLSPVGLAKSPVFHRGWKTFELETVMRQKAGSNIINLANALRDTIRTGQFTPLEQFECAEIQFVAGAEFQEIVDDEFSENYWTVNHGKILGWTNDKVSAYNDYVRKLQTTNHLFEIDELVVTNIPVIQGEQTYFNTDDITVITHVKEDEEYGIEGCWYELDDTVHVFQANNRDEVQALLKKLAAEAKTADGSWKPYFEAKEFFADLRAVHSCTTHKSQGSTYGTSYIDLPDIGMNRRWEEVARLLYVAVTRAKDKVVFYGKLPPKYQTGKFQKLH